MKAIALMIVVVAGCGSKQPPARTNHADQPAASCSTTAAELKTYIAQVVDPAAKPTPPWSSGDATTDHEIEEARAEMREKMKPADPSQKAQPLAAGIKPGRLDHALDSCAPAQAKIKEIANAEPGKQAAAWANLADGIAACECKVNVPLVRALIYVMQRGPE